MWSVPLKFKGHKYFCQTFQTRCYLSEMLSLARSLQKNRKLHTRKILLLEFDGIHSLAETPLWGLPSTPVIFRGCIFKWERKSFFLGPPFTLHFWFCLCMNVKTVWWYVPFDPFPYLLLYLNKSHVHTAADLLFSQCTVHLSGISAQKSIRIQGRPKQMYLTVIFRASFWAYLFHTSEHCSETLPHRGESPSLSMTSVCTQLASFIIDIPAIIGHSCV